MIRSVLDPDVYSATCRQAYIENNVLHLIWTIDTGLYKWRNVTDRFSVLPDLLGKLVRVMTKLNYSPIGDSQKEGYEIQFIGIRAKINVDTQVTENEVKNVIKSYDLPMAGAEIDVLAEKKDDYFFEKQKKKRLPINV